MSALDNAVEKIYLKIAETGDVTQEQLSLIALYEHKNKPKKDVLSTVNKVVGIINKNLKDE